MAYKLENRPSRSFVYPLLRRRVPLSRMSTLRASRTKSPSSGTLYWVCGSWLFIPRRRAAANADSSTTSLPSGFYTPESLATYLGVSTSTIYSWNSNGYGPPFVKLGNLVRYTYEDVELWLARQLELSRG